MSEEFRPGSDAPSGPEPWEDMEAFVASGDSAGLETLIDALTPAEVARALSRVSEEVQSRMLSLLPAEAAADLLEELSDVFGADILEELPADRAADIVEEMESDERADVLAELDEDDVEAILRKMTPEEAEDARQLLTYEEDTAGGLMATEFVSFSVNLCVSDVLEDLRENKEEYSDYGVQYAYVVSEKEALVGVIRLRDIIFAAGDAPLPSVMIANPLYAMTDTPLDELEQIFDRYTFVGLPVTDSNGRLVGVVRRSDVEEAQGERAGEALMRFGGIMGGEELRSMPAWARARRRLYWLAVNLGLSLVAASVVLFYEESVREIIALPFFIPVIGNMSGCTGNQAVAVSIRELTMGLIKPEDFVRVFIKEAHVGLINGTAIGLLLAGVSFVLFHNPLLSVLVGGAMAVNSLIALSLGGLVPLAMKRFGVDAALAAPLAVTTLSDLCGFLLVLMLVNHYLPQLV